ncbi:MAG: hypothetical protein M3Y25_02730 [Thermoproteota archaeon]|nr:hypothetical protein [Thermoproteota archaeon]
MALGDISKIPTDGLVVSSDSDQVGIVDRFNDEFMFVNESITNYKFKIPLTDIDRIENTKIKLKIVRKDVEKYILKGDD